MSAANRHSIAPLTRRLLPPDAGLEKRLELLAQAVGGDTLLVPEDCRGWPEASRIIRTAITDQRATLVYGDYDVDGVVATLLLYRFLRAHDVPGNSFIPSRMQHGYGLDMGIVRQAIEQGYQTLITVDCGSANLEEIRYAVDHGLQVAVLDHHTCGTELPPAPIVNSHLDQRLPPLCAAGLVYHLLRRLRCEMTAAQAPEPDETELAGLATIADVVPLVPQNWILAHHALAALPETLNYGLAALLRISGLHGLTRLTGRQAAFSIVPLLNAAGRMKTAKIAFDLLAADSRERAGQLAALMAQLNDERKQTTDLITRAAIIQAESQQQAAGLALYDADWHPGVLGIVAARAAELTNKAVAVCTDAPGERGLITGSIRATDVDVMQALRSCQDQLHTFGGHAQAAGIKVAKPRWGEFQAAWAAAVAQAGRIQTQVVSATEQVELGEISAAFEADLWRLAPFGQDYDPPRAVLSGVRISRVGYMGRDKTHLNLQVTDGVRQARVVGFNQSHLFRRLEVGASVSPIVEFDPDNYNNRQTIMLRLIGLAD
ncbi:DHH family phosphoesterase [bacterium]|nr:DHH family phosphoesterase [bacterium]